MASSAVSFMRLIITRQLVSVPLKYQRGQIIQPDAFTGSNNSSIMTSSGCFEEVFIQGRGQQVVRVNGRSDAMLPDTHMYKYDVKHDEQRTEEKRKRSRY